ncbi:hypothetical protein P8452_37589 [Trifolium repens]|nr:hypothetical protein P8452_37589 [Trifolium repens]
MGVEEGWSENSSENSSEGGSVKNDEEGGLPVNITEGKTQEVIGKAVSIVPYEEREAQSQEVGGKRKTKGDGAVVEVADGDVVERREADCGSFCSAVIETPQIRARSLKMLPQGVENGAEDKDADYCVTEACVEVGFVGDEVEFGPNPYAGPLDSGSEWAQRKGTGVVCWEENKNRNKTLMGSTSLWASDVDRG